MNYLHILKKFFVSLTQERRCMSCYLPFNPPLTHHQNKNYLEQHICITCNSLLKPREKGYCPTCGYIYLNEKTPITSCQRCITHPPIWKNFRFLFPYIGKYKQLIVQAKFKGESSILELLGNLISTYCLDLPIPDVIIPMPLHPSRLYKRGFNQCQEISRPIAKKLNCPINQNLLYRTIHTKHQTGLSKQQRLQNIKKAFIAKSEVENLRILLVDDIMTTGTTLQQATITLLNKKAKAIDICVVARTPDFS